MIDILILAILGWCTLRGWYKGTVRLIVDLFTTISVFMVVSHTSQWVKDLIVSPQSQTAFSFWVAKHIHSIPPASAVYQHLTGPTAVGLGLTQESTVIAQNIYIAIITVLLSVAIIVGIQLLLAAFQILTAVSTTGKRYEQVLGGLLGVGLGMFINSWVISLSSIATWFIGFEWLDKAIAGSVLIKLLVFKL